MEISDSILVQTDVDWQGQGIDPETWSKVLSAMCDLISETVDVNYQGERVLQILRLQKADYFYRGIQNIAPTLDPQTGSISWAIYGATPSTQVRDVDSADRVQDYNPRKTKAYGEKFVAVLGQREFWNCEGMPENPNSEDDKIAARHVNLLLQLLYGQWKVKSLNYRLFYYLFKCGPVYGIIQPRKDGKKFGFRDVPNVSMQQHDIPGGYQCMQCGNETPGEFPPLSGGMFCSNPYCGAPLGPESYQPPTSVNVPVEGEPTQEPNISVDLTLANGYTFSVPFNVVELDDPSPWAVNECEKDRGILLDYYPNARQIVGDVYGTIASSDPSSTTAAVARLAAQSQTGAIRTSHRNLWSWRTTWLHSSSTNLVRDDKMRGIIQALFPNGAKVVTIQNKMVAIFGQNYLDYLSACTPSMSDYLVSDGVSWGMFGMEDYWANLLNLTAMTLETGIPTWLVDPDYADVDALNKSRYTPNRFLKAIPRTGQSLENGIAMFPTANFPEQIPQIFGVAEEVMQQYFGLLPQVYGQMPGGLTLGQARMMLNQGLLQLSTVAGLATEFWEKTETNAVKLFCQVAAENPQYQGQTIDLDAIRKGRWVIKGSAAIPRTFAERKEMLQEVISQNPDVAKALHITDPVNFGELTDLLDLPGIKNPDVDAITALDDIIDQLWKASPIPGPPGSPPTPSISFDPIVFNPDIVVSVCRAALLSVTGQQRSMTPGYENVRAFLQSALDAQRQAAKPQMQPIRMSYTVDLTKLPENQMEAILAMEGITLPPPQGLPVDTASKMAEQEHKAGMDALKPPTGAEGPGAPGGGPAPAGPGAGGPPSPGSGPSGPGGPGGGMPPPDPSAQQMQGGPDLGPVM